MVTKPRLGLRSVITTWQVCSGVHHVRKHLTMHWGYADEQNRLHHCSWGVHSLEVKTDSSDLQSLLTHVREIDVAKVTYI